jgi:hypothetical protein
MAQKSAKNTLLIRWLNGSLFIFIFFPGLLNAWSEFYKYIKSYMLNKHMGHHLTLFSMIFSWMRTEESFGPCLYWQRSFT